MMILMLHFYQVCIILHVYRFFDCILKLTSFPLLLYAGFFFFFCLILNLVVCVCLDDFFTFEIQDIIVLLIEAGLIDRAASLGK